MCVLFIGKCLCMCVESGYVSDYTSKRNSVHVLCPGIHHDLGVQRCVCLTTQPWNDSHGLLVKRRRIVQKVLLLGARGRQNIEPFLLRCTTPKLHSREICFAMYGGEIERGPKISEFELCRTNARAPIHTRPTHARFTTFHSSYSCFYLA